MRLQVEDSARAGAPASVGLRERFVQLVEQATIAVHHKDMPVASLDGRIRRDRIRPGIAFAGILESDRNLGLHAGHHHIRNADGLTAIGP